MFSAAKTKINFPIDEDWDLHGFDEEFKYNKDIKVTPEDLVKKWKELYLIRRMENKILELYQDRHIFGFCHLCNGQEAIYVGMEGALNFNDMLVTAYRDHANAYLRGISIYEIFCEMMSKKDGSSKAKGGSMHFYNKKTNFYGGNGIVGAQVPLGAGLAFSLKYKKNTENVAVTLYGDGGANQGQVYEAANLARIWNLPTIFVCENNHVAMGTVTNEHTGDENFHKKLPNIPGMKVFGQNVFEIEQAFALAKAYAVKKGPIVININTYRYAGHSVSDPGYTYRVPEEYEIWKTERDPVANTREAIIKNGVMTEKEVKVIEKEIKNMIHNEAKRAIESEKAPMTFLYEDVYHPDTKNFIRSVNYEDSIFVTEKLVN